MTFTPEQIKALEAKLDPAHVAQRTQSGRSLSYIEGWWAESEANRIFGYDGWDTETVYERCVAERQRKIGRDGKDGWGVSYVCKVRVTIHAGERKVVREGVGAGHGIDADLGLAHESAIKEAATDAEKRALKTFGNPFGLALYDKTQANVGVEAPPEQRGRKSSAQAKRDGDHDKIKADIAKADLDGLRDWFENFDSYTAHLPLSWLDPVRDQLEARRAELMRPPESIAAEAQMDDAFKATVGTFRPTGQGGLAGSANQIPAE